MTLARTYQKALTAATKASLRGDRVAFDGANELAIQADEAFRKAGLSPHQFPAVDKAENKYSDAVSAAGY